MKCPRCGYTESCEAVAFAAAKRFDLPFVRLISKQRDSEVVEARNAAFYVLYEIASEPLRVIAGYFGRDHSTVIHGVARAKEWITCNPEFKASIDAIMSEVGNDIRPAANQCG
jgi:chromosomal replication initiator protein